MANTVQSVTVNDTNGGTTNRPVLFEYDEGAEEVRVVRIADDGDAAAKDTLRLDAQAVRKLRVFFDDLDRKLALES